ncbi:AfsR/SARP family transcriptional regulator [Actinoallomurus iriomotensis]|uniref:SARP family transcriptional regulator n=1 Tax=Actinoallomurus iriomotensis TaxID=478107 RepID=A0A9W6S8I8_9ACTN|nr:BTAD domain-containing putative transcriptional regulator [Actinoallomurus iriomotensis]GLY89116.1 SARP family transcriptional regulator [Actinoallomurus iriomotensis]
MSDRPLRFGVLGPLVVRADGGNARMGGPKQRLLLAALLLAEGRPVSADKLVDTLWPQRPPRSAVANLHTYVSSLRSCLPPVPDGHRVRRHADGYSISLLPGELDLQVFEELLDESAHRKAAGRPDDAESRIAEALALWRGEPLEDLPPSPLWQAETARLVERRLEAVEERCALRLAAGRHAENVAELRSLLVRHPLREGLWQQLMLALHAGGRQAEALGAYSEAREHLVDELGTEPGLRLRLLHEAILRGAGPAAEDTGVFPLCQLPGDTPDFTGREAEARELAGILQDASPAAPPPVVVVTGAPGVGKSAFALHVCHALRGSFPEGQLYFDLSGTGGQPRDPGDVLVEVLRTLGFTGAAVPRTLSERAALFRSRLADRRVLVLVDGATDAAQVRPLLPATPGSATVVTSRWQLADLSGAHHIELDVFRPGAAVELLARVAGRERVRREPDQAAAIIRDCGCLPLAIRIAGARLSGRQGWSLRVLGERLADESRRLSELQVGDLGVRATFDLSVRLLDPEAARTFRLLGLLGTPELPGWVAGALLDRADGDDVLEELVDASLAHHAGPGPDGLPRYRLHGLLRQYAHEEALAAPDADQDAAIVRLLATWLDLAEQAAARLPASLLTPLSGDAPRRPLDPSVAERLTADPMAWFDTERRGLLDAVAVAAEYGRAAHAWELAIAMVPYFDQRSLYEDWRTAHRHALRAVRAAGDRRGEAVLLRTLGQVYVYQDEYDEALAAIERSRTLCRALDDARGEALADVGLATLHRILGRADEALDRYRAALPVLATGDDRHIQAQLRGSIAAILISRDRLDEAGEWLATALARARESADPHREARVLSQVAELYLRRGDATGARARLEEALAVFEELGDDRCAAYALLDLARCHLGADNAAADATLDRALESFRRAGNRRGHAAALLMLGEVRMAEGDATTAGMYLREAAGMWHELGDGVQEATAREHLARLGPSGR